MLYIIMLYLAMKTVGMNQFYNSYGLIQFVFRARTKPSFECMRLMGMARLNGLAPTELECTINTYACS